jgi:hypothetical protein
MATRGRGGVRSIEKPGTFGTNPLSAISPAGRGRPAPSPSAYVITAPCENPPITTRSYGMPEAAATSSSHSEARANVAVKVGGSG